MSLRFWSAVAVLIVSVCFGFSPAAFAEPPSDSKNFSTPPAVPNYFSNESGPVMRSPAPLPSVLPARTGAAPVEEESPSAVAAAPAPRPAAAAKPARRIITIVTSRTHGRVAHAKTRVSDRRKIAVARGRSSKPARIVARTDRPRAGRLAHAEPHGARSRPIAAKGQRAGRG